MPFFLKFYVEQIKNSSKPHKLIKQHFRSLCSVALSTVLSTFMIPVKENALSLALGSRTHLGLLENNWYFMN